MSRLAIAVACSVLVAGSAAHAQSSGGISGIQGSAGSSVFLSRNSDPATFPAGAGTTDGGPPGASFNSFVNVTPQQITFESANVSAAPFANSTSFSTVQFNVNNNTGQDATLKSTITGAGLGFYLADTSSGCLYSACPQVAANSPYTFASLPGTNGGADVSFDFSITRAGVPGGAGPTVLYSLSGSLSMNHDGTPIFLNDALGGFPDSPGATGSGARSLANFGDALGNDFNAAAGIGAATALGYVWDPTDITVDLGSLANQTLIYTTIVSSESSLPCVTGTFICLVAYSGFGDPVGRGGGINNLTAGGARSLGDFARFGGGGLDAGGGRINGINFGPSVFDVPTFNDGLVTFEGGNGVPEPTMWMTLIAGFGLLGAALRRRRVLAYN